jgi:hypothetical protein
VGCGLSATLLFPPGHTAIVAWDAADKMCSKDTKRHTADNSAAQEHCEDWQRTNGNRGARKALVDHFYRPDDAVTRVAYLVAVLVIVLVVGAHAEVKADTAEAVTAQVVDTVVLAREVEHDGDGIAVRYPRALEEGEVEVHARVVRVIGS